LLLTIIEEHKQKSEKNKSDEIIIVRGVVEMPDNASNKSRKSLMSSSLSPPNMLFQAFLLQTIYPNNM